MYDVAGTKFSSFFKAVAFATPTRANVIEVATGLVRWTPAPLKAGRTRHVLVNADGTKTEFGSVKR
jgi:hypothetical protein